MSAVPGVLAVEGVAMRPGKPLMAGRLDEMALLGLPGNPVSAIVTAILFLQPLVDAVWTHLGTFTHTEGRSKPELGVSVSGGGAVDRSHGSAT